MKLHLKRALRGLAAAVIVATGVGVVPQAAQANGLGNWFCPDPTRADWLNVCLYNNTSLQVANGFWRRSWGQVGTGCQNLSLHTWTTGGSVNDAASSLGVTVRTDTGAYRVRFYQWTNCSSANGYFDLIVSGSGVDARTIVDLSGPGWNNEIGSVQIFVA
ncbi:hypothetical protein [Actinoplanes sp. M2I2]|uniref:hypothetical protein n=1 Tax=Actinoplanes sp. M2I2 TaxID=1734444 RepID=UPI002021AFD4|nr:hypothetical protein [Actinoplanes sp. M2I2]